MNKFHFEENCGNYLDNDIYGFLRINYELKKHDFFYIENNNIYSDVFIPLSIAILGGEIEAKTLFGVDKIKIPSKSQDEDEIVFKENVKIIFYLILFYSFLIFS